MAQDLQPRVIRPSAYVPTQPRSGSVSDDIIYRMQNMIIQGNNPLTYLNNYAGSLSLSEPIDIVGSVAKGQLTGTLATNVTTGVVTGTGTAFRSELNPGQYVLIVDTSNHYSSLLAVKTIVSDTGFVAWRIDGVNQAGVTGYRLPIIFPVDQDRGSCIWGNFIRNDKGTLLGVGAGVARVNGAALSASWTLTRAPQIALYNSGAGTYTEFPLGMSVLHGTISAASNTNPVSLTSAAHGLTTGNGVRITGATGSWTPINGSFVATVTGANTFTIPIDSTGFGALTGTITWSAVPIVTAVAGGTKGMQAGNYSVVILPAKTQTLGYGNPSEKVTVTIATNDKVQLVMPAMDVVHGQNGWWIGVTRYSDALGADLNYLEGPWYIYMPMSTGATTGYTTTIEWLDAQVERNDLVTFNNDAPSDANWVAMLNNVPVWISCQGPNSSSPGPFIFPAKPGNIEAAPVDIAFSSSPPETIVGAVSAAGRIYLLTTNHLQIAQGTPQEDVPVLIRPFWTVGFARPDQLVFINEQLYGHSVQGPARSASDGVSGSEEFDFAVDVSEITDPWIAGHVIVAYDPKNNAVCYFHSANAPNSSGFWTTRVLMFGLRQNRWIGDITLSATNQDMIVTSAAMVGNSLYMLMGGRLANDTIAIGTYRFDAAAGTAVSWYAAPVFSDHGVETRSHVVKRVRVTYKGTGVSAGVFGAQPTESIPVTTLETGNSSSLTGAISVPTASTPTQSQQLQVNCPNLVQSTVRIEGSYPTGTGPVDSVHEIVIQSAIEGVRI